MDLRSTYHSCNHGSRTAVRHTLSRRHARHASRITGVGADSILIRPNPDRMTIAISHAPSSDRLVEEVEPGVFQVDHHFRGAPGVIASYLIVDGDALTLVEAGPASTVDTLLAGVRQAGFDPERIERIVVTHIHLDHAGAAGTLLRRLPRARLFVHPVGAPHLVDPAKLIA